MPAEICWGTSGVAQWCAVVQMVGQLDRFHAVLQRLRRARADGRGHGGGIACDAPGSRVARGDAAAAVYKAVAERPASLCTEAGVLAVPLTSNTPSMPICRCPATVQM